MAGQLQFDPVPRRELPEPRRVLRDIEVAAVARCRQHACLVECARRVGVGNHRADGEIGAAEIMDLRVHEQHVVGIDGRDTGGVVDHVAHIGSGGCTRHHDVHVRGVQFVRERGVARADGEQQGERGAQHAGGDEDGRAESEEGPLVAAPLVQGECAHRVTTPSH